MFWNKKGKITGFKFGPVEIQKIGRNKWKWIEHNLYDPKMPPIVEIYHGNDDLMKRWARDRQRELEFLLKIQKAQRDGRVSAVDMYRILAKRDQDRGGCKLPHTHSAKCKYHPHHPD